MTADSARGRRPRHKAKPDKPAESKRPRGTRTKTGRPHPAARIVYPAFYPAGLAIAMPVLLQEGRDFWWTISPVLILVGLLVLIPFTVAVVNGRYTISTTSAVVLRKPTRGGPCGPRRLPRREVQNERYASSGGRPRSFAIT